MQDEKRVVVVGGGISGLVLGYELGRLGHSVRVLEKSRRPGGNVRTDLHHGFRCEWGPNGFPASDPGIGRLAEALGIRDEIVPAGKTARSRWVLRDARLRALPTSPKEFLKSDVLPWAARMRVLAESACPVRKEPAEESVFQFFQRRLGRQSAHVLADALVTGVYAGDPRRLGLRSAFPRLYEMEQEHGSLFRALGAKRRMRGSSDPGPRMALASFASGMETLPGALARSLGDRLRLDARVRRVARKPDGSWCVEIDGGEVVGADHVVLACPSWVASPVLQELDDRLAARLAELPSAPVAVVCLGFAANEIGQVEPGFGFLVPHGEKLGILGTVFESWIFPHRAPEGSVLWRVLIGGARDRSALDLDDVRLVERALQGLAQALGIRAHPEMTVVLRHPRGIPQYDVGHVERISRIESHLQRHPGLTLCGSSYRGVAVHQCIQEAFDLAAHLVGKGSEITGTRS